MSKPKILVLTSIYPGPDIPENFTPVVHYFVKEWIKMGADVRVIHSPSYFIMPLYWIPKFIRKWVSKKVGFPLPEKRLSSQNNFELDNIKIIRLPIFKFLPMGKFKERRLEKQADKIFEEISSENFIPDVIVSHWINPQVYLSYLLKSKLKCKTVMVLHESGESVKVYDNYKELINNIDVWGYRSDRIKDAFYNLFNIKADFKCCSGIPDYYYNNVPNRNWKKCNRFVFVGGLLPRKYPDLLIKVIPNIFDKEEYSISIIGDGPMSASLHKLAEPIKDKVIFYGRIPRAETIKVLDNSDVFIMVSRNEVFGLVYLEAMARGCLVIASKNEGMQGIIKNGVNGFLCDSGNADSLNTVICRINSLSPAERKQVSNNAIETAKKFSDREVAEEYLRNIL